MKVKCKIAVFCFSKFNFIINRFLLFVVISINKISCLFLDMLSLHNSLIRSILDFVEPCVIISLTCSTFHMIDQRNWEFSNLVRRVDSKCLEFVDRLLFFSFSQDLFEFGNGFRTLSSGLLAKLIKDVTMYGNMIHFDYLMEKCNMKYLISTNVSKTVSNFCLNALLEASLHTRKIPVCVEDLMISNISFIPSILSFYTLQDDCFLVCSVFNFVPLHLKYQIICGVVNESVLFDAPEVFSYFFNLSKTQSINPNLEFPLKSPCQFKIKVASKCLKENILTIKEIDNLSWGLWDQQTFSVILESFLTLFVELYRDNETKKHLNSINFPASEVFLPENILDVQTFDQIQDESDIFCKNSLSEVFLMKNSDRSKLAIHLCRSHLEHERTQNQNINNSVPLSRNISVIASLQYPIWDSSFSLLNTILPKVVTLFYRNLNTSTTQIDLQTFFHNKFSVPPVLLSPSCHSSFFPQHLSVNELGLEIIRNPSIQLLNHILFICGINDDCGHNLNIQIRRCDTHVSEICLCAVLESVATTLTVSRAVAFDSPTGKAILDFLHVCMRFVFPYLSKSHSSYISSPDGRKIGFGCYKGIQMHHPKEVISSLFLAGGLCRLHSASIVTKMIAVLPPPDSERMFGPYLTRLIVSRLLAIELTHQHITHMTRTNLLTNVSNRRHSLSSSFFKNDHYIFSSEPVSPLSLPLIRNQPTSLNESACLLSSTELLTLSSPQFESDSDAASLTANNGESVRLQIPPPSVSHVPTVDTIILNSREPPRSSFSPISPLLASRHLPQPSISPLSRSPCAPRNKTRRNTVFSFSFSPSHSSSLVLPSHNPSLITKEENINPLLFKQCPTLFHASVVSCASRYFADANHSQPANEFKMSAIHDPGNYMKEKCELNLPICDVRLLQKYYFNDLDLVKYDEHCSSVLNSPGRFSLNNRESTFYETSYEGVTNIVRLSSDDTISYNMHSSLAPQYMGKNAFRAVKSVKRMYTAETQSTTDYEEVSRLSSVEDNVHIIRSCEKFQRQQKGQTDSNKLELNILKNCEDCRALRNCDCGNCVNYFHNNSELSNNYQFFSGLVDVWNRFNIWSSGSQISTLKKGTFCENYYNCINISRGCPRCGEGTLFHCHEVGFLDAS